MRLPFTTQEFFDLFAAYNAACWPAVLALWIASLPATARSFGHEGKADRWISALLVAQWAWSGVVYHAVFFTRINPAAWLFAALFVFEAALLLWSGVIRRDLAFSPVSASWTRFGWLLTIYALAYPLINIVEHGSVTRIPTFGLPCPTTIFTAGLLLRASSLPRLLVIVPIAWSVIGGSAAFLLGVPTDYALPVAGASLAVLALRTPKVSAPRAVNLA